MPFSYTCILYTDLISLSQFYFVQLMFHTIGIKVNYAISVGDILLGPTTLRHLVLCCSGDHVGICEVGKFIKCGKKGCRRCDTTSKLIGKKCE